eukprot:g1607.t1
MFAISKTIIFTSLCIVAVYGVQPIQDGSVTTEQEFDLWASTYNKVYSSAEEKNARMGVFLKNKEFVVNHNKEFEKGVHTFTLELNAFADITNEEYKQKYLGLNINIGNYLGSKADTYVPEVDAADVPDAWDWRINATNVVGPVKNQGGCGSCWAFSAVATMEGQLNKKTNKINSLSEQELVDCVRGGKDTCTQGGEMYDGEEYGVTQGMVSEADYPYQGSSGNKCGVSGKKIVHKYSGYTNITAFDENALKSATYEQPIISVGIDASSIWFQLYFGGVFNDKSCKTAAKDLDHGVAVVGYGTFKGKDFWMVRNSWGSFWGLKGYIMMSRNANNQCGIATQASFAKL